MKAITEQEFQLLSQYVYDYCGINLERKKNLVEGRLTGLLMEKGFEDFSSYYDYLINDRSLEAVSILVDRISTNHTYFMREEQHFEYFLRNILPYLKATVKDRDLRIWSAGCASGEEPYTLAMITADFFGTEQARWDTRILATDISSAALHKAEQGIYSNDEINQLPPQFRLNYFKKIDQDNNMVAEELKKQVIFRKFNLMESVFPFRQKFHVIFCRNVMLYFDAITKRELVKRFYDCTARGGYLFIGQSESLNRDETLYQYISPAIYRKG